MLCAFQARAEQKAPKYTTLRRVRVSMFTLGGGYERYQYITLENSQPVQKRILDESISDDFEDKVYQENQHLQAEAKDVVENDGDVPWLIIP